MAGRTIAQHSDEYPALLRQIAHPPQQLHVSGRLDHEQPLVAIVGTRKASRYGREMTRTLAEGLARHGIGIVSGLALGIDGEAHRAAIEAGGYTVAVLGCGLDRIYPAKHRGLAADILKHDGALISEYDPGTPPLKQHFPARNRIVAGLCVGTVIVEAAERSGALITASFALEQNREVMAVPGAVTNPQSMGTNLMIQTGAALITSVADVLHTLGYAATPVAEVTANSPQEERILKVLQQQAADSATLIERSGLDTATFNRTVTRMEIEHKIRRLDNDQWALRT